MPRQRNYPTIDASGIEITPSRTLIETPPVQGGRSTITIDIDPPADRLLKQLRIAVRHPRRQKAQSVTVNGTNFAIEAETVTLTTPSGHLRIVANYDSAPR